MINTVVRFGFASLLFASVALPAHAKAYADQPRTASATLEQRQAAPLVKVAGSQCPSRRHQLC